MTRPDAGFSRWLAPWCIIAAVVLAYAGSLRAPFLFDDAGAVVDNTTIRQLWSLDVFQPPADGSTTTGRPLVNFSFALNYAISGENAWSYHALNVALHVAAALALFGLVRRTASRWGALRPARFALVVALVWALHPLQTETVVCIAQRTELLCGLLYLLALYAFGRATLNVAPASSRQSPDGRLEAGATRWLVASVACCALGMLAKEVMVTAPLVVLLYDRTFVAGTFAAAWRARGACYLALAATWVLLAVLVLMHGGTRGVSAGVGVGVSSWDYLLTQCEALVLYLKLAAWPHPLVLDYGTRVVTDPGEVWWQALLIATLLGATLWALVRRPRAGFLGALFFLVLAPSSSVVPLVTQTIAEHRMYLPLAAIVTGFAWLAARLVRNTVVAAVAGTLGCLVLTAARTQLYRDPAIVWVDTMLKEPRNPRAHHNLALLLRERGKTDAANARFARAIELDPRYVIARYNWAAALLEQGRTADAIAQFEAAIDLAEKSPGASADPNLGDAHFQLATLAERAGDRAGAERHYEAALRTLPRHAGAHIKLGVLLARSERLEPAALHLRTAVEIEPANADALANLGNVYLLQEKPRDALACYEQVLRLRPGDRRTLENIRLAREALR